MSWTTRVLVVASILACAAVASFAAEVSSWYDYKSTISSDANGALDLKAMVYYNNAVSNAPIAVLMHGYSGSGTPADSNASWYAASADWLRDKGFFVVTVSMRGRQSLEHLYDSDGVRDSGGLEIYDIYDAVEAVKHDPQFAGRIDPTNVSISGYSGGGGNTLSALTKFPDYFRAGASFFGISDYGLDPVHGWYVDGAGSRQAQLDIDVGDPTTGNATVLDKYMARASNLAAKNNPYSEIHLFVNGSGETICPPIQSTSYRDNAVAAESFPGEFNNITVHIGQAGTYYDFNGNGQNDPDEEQWWVHAEPDANHRASSYNWYIQRLLSGAIG